MARHGMVGRLDLADSPVELGLAVPRAPPTGPGAGVARKLNHSDKLTVLHVDILESKTMHGNVTGQPQSLHARAVTHSFRLLSYNQHPLPLRPSNYSHL